MVVLRLRIRTYPPIFIPRTFNGILFLHLNLVRCQPDSGKTVRSKVIAKIFPEVILYHADQHDDFISQGHPKCNGYFKVSQDSGFKTKKAYFLSLIRLEGGKKSTRRKRSIFFSDFESLLGSLRF